MNVGDRVQQALDALYACDDAGRLLHPRNPRLVAPRVHFVRTVEANHWRYAASLPAEVVERVEPLLAAEPVAHDSGGWEAKEPRCLAAVREVLDAHQPLAREYRGPAFAFPEVVPPPATPVEALGEAPGIVALSPLEWVAEVAPSDLPMVVARDDQGRVVSQCHCARKGTTAAHAGVETASGARRLGLGTAVVAGWASAVRAVGLEPYYGTWWANTASRALAARLGLVMFAEDWHVD